MGAVMDSGEAPDLKVGSVVGPYEIVGTLGTGGMGVVYRARHLQLARTVALKVLARTFASDPEFIERFRREAKALAALSHPNVVMVYDFGIERGLPWLAMEYVDGVSLRKLITERRLPPEEALGIVPQLCDALEYAHAAGIVHRDIKPENILIDRTGAVKIADFGLSKMLDRAARGGTLTGTDVAMGTPHYMAPEQFENFRGVDHRADIFSMGVVFYEMLTGELPLGRFHPPSRKARVNSRLDEIVMKTLEREPDERYQRAREVKRDLTGMSVGAPPPRHGLKYTANVPWWVFVLVMVVLVGLACAAGMTLLLVRAAPAPVVVPPPAPPRAPIPAPLPPPVVPVPLEDDGARDLKALKKLAADDSDFEKVDAIAAMRDDLLRKWPGRADEAKQAHADYLARYEKAAADWSVENMADVRKCMDEKKWRDAIKLIDAAPRKWQRSSAWKDWQRLRAECQQRIER